MLQYLKNVILAGTRERVSAFLAVIAGITLCFGFLVLLVYLFFGKAVTAAFALVCASITALATFNKIDNNIKIDDK